MLPSIRLDRERHQPLHDQLAAELRSSILAGNLPPGVPLPSSRRAAFELGVSRNVVVQAYELLQLEGYLDSAVGSGTWVRESLPRHLLGPVEPADTKWSSGSAAGRLSERGERLAGAGRRALEGSRPNGPFRPGAVDPELFPARAWARISGRLWRSRGRELVPYGDPGGHRSLREQLALHLARHRAVRCDAERIVVVPGSQQALDLVVRLLTDPGDRAIVEEPGYPGIHTALAANGVRSRPAAVDADGIDDAAVRAAGEARMLYATPSHQYPLGSTLTLDRRLRLLDWAAGSDAWIVEDDYDSEFRYGSRPLPSLQGLDPHGRVIYLGTFSKILAPGLRLAYLVVPETLVDAFRAAVRATLHHPPIALQATLGAFIAEGHLERHVARVLGVYRKRRSALVDALSDRLGDVLELLPSAAGLHLTALMPPGVDDAAVSRAAARRSIDAPALSGHYLAPPRRAGVLLGFGSADVDQLRDAVDGLSDAIDESCS